MTLQILLKGEIRGQSVEHLGCSVPTLLQGCLEPVAQPQLRVLGNCHSSLGSFLGLPTIQTWDPLSLLLSCMIKRSQQKLKHP